MVRFVMAALLSLALALSARAESVDVAGVKYETQQDIGGQKLMLNGVGIRYKAIFKVYTAGLYLANKAASPDEVFAAQGGKRLHIQMLRDVDGDTFGKLFTKGVQDNVSREEFSKSINGVLRVAEMFAAKKKLTTGEHFTIDWVPGTGTVVYINGKVQGEPIKEPEFYTTLLKIWLGNSPADSGLKDALLGKRR